VGIQLHLAFCRFRIQNNILKVGCRSQSSGHPQLGAKCRFTATGTGSSNYVALAETVIQLGDERYWLYAAVDPRTNEFLHVRPVPITNSGLTHVFLRELSEKHDIDDAVFLIDDADHLQVVLSQLGLRFHVHRHGNRNSVEHIFRMVKR